MKKKDQILLEEAYQKVVEDMGPGTTPSTPNLDTLPSPSDVQAYNYFLRNFRIKGGSKLVFDFLKNTKEDFSADGGLLDKPITMNNLLQLSKYVGPDDNDSLKAGYNYNRAQGARGMMGPRFNKAFDSFLHNASKNTQTNQVAKQPVTK